MRGIPKIIQTKQDVLNIVEMAEGGELAASDVLFELKAIEAGEWMNIPIRALSEDRKTVTVCYLAEAQVGMTVKNSSATTISTITHNEPEQQQSGMSGGFETTTIKLSKALSEDLTMLHIPANRSPMEEFDISASEMTALIARAEAIDA